MITGSALSTRRNPAGETVVDGKSDFTAIPYYAWAHRGLHQMTVWPAREVSAAKPLPRNTLALSSTITTSGGEDQDALNDQFLPRNSNDPGVPRFDWWPKKGSTEWVQCVFAAPSRVSKTAVYWFDDTGTGECRVPKAWRVLYRDGGDGQEWKPVSNATAQGKAKDKMNRMTFDPVTTDALRLEVTFEEGFSAGLYEWEIQP